MHTHFVCMCVCVCMSVAMFVYLRARNNRMLRLVFIDVRFFLFFLSLSQATDSFMTFEGHQIQGAPKILEKVQVSKATTRTFWIFIYTCFILYSIHRVWVSKRSRASSPPSTRSPHSMVGFWSMCLDACRWESHCRWLQRQIYCGLCVKPFISIYAYYIYKHIWNRIEPNRLCLSIDTVHIQYILHIYLHIYRTNSMQTDEDQPHAYIQTFVLKPVGVSFFVQHDIFRLALHDV